MKRKAASDEFLSAWKDLVSFADENPGVGMMLSEANRLYTFYRWPSRGDQQEAEGARADIVEELDRLIDARSQYEDDAELVALLEATRDAAQDDTLENALEDDPYKSVGTMKRKRSSRDLDSFFEEFDFDWDALAEEAGADAVVDSFGTGLAAAISERDGRKLRTATRMSSGTGRGLSEDLRNMLEEFDGWLAEEKSASRGVTTKAYAYQVFVVLDEEETAQAIIDLAAEYGGDEADSAGRTLKFEFDTQEASSAFREEVEPMEGVNSATQSIEGGKAASRGVTTKAAPSAEDFITRLGGAMYPIERDLEQHGDFAGGELMDATAALGQALVAADEGDWAKVAEHLDTAASALDADEVAEDGGLASTVTALDAFREEALGYAKEEKTMSRRALATKGFDLTAAQVYELSDDVLMPLSRTLDASLPSAVGDYRADVSNAAAEMSLLSQGLPEDIDGSTITAAAAELTAANRALLNAMPMGDFADSIVDDFSELPGAIDALGAALDSAIAAVDALDRDLQVSIDETQTQEDPQDDSRSVRRRVTLETSTEQVMGMLQALVGTWSQLQDVPSVFAQWQVDARDTVLEAYEELGGTETKSSEDVTTDEADEFWAGLDLIQEIAERYVRDADGTPTGEAYLEILDQAKEIRAAIDDSAEGAGDDQVESMFLDIAGVAAGIGSGGANRINELALAAVDYSAKLGRKTMSKRALRTKYCDYPSYAGMPFGSPTLSTRYQDVPAEECKDLSYSVREAGEALEAASAIYLQRAAAAARGDDDSAPDVAAMNTLNGVAVQLETLADRLLAVSEGSSQYLSTGPGDTQCFYSWPDCLPSCLAAVEGALGSVSGDAEYLEVAAQLTVVRDMLRTLLEDENEETETSDGGDDGDLTKGHSDMRKQYRGTKTKASDERFDEVADLIQNALGDLEESEDPDAEDASGDLISAFDSAKAGDAEDCADSIRDALTWTVIASDNAVTGSLTEALTLLEEIDSATAKGHDMRNTRTKKSSRRSRFGDARNAMDTLGELSTQLDRVTDEAWTGRRRIVDSKARAALETAVAAASFVAESVRESVDTKAPLQAEQLGEELGRASDALRVLEKSGDPWATTFRDDLSEFGSLLGRSASALDRYLDEKGEESGDEAGDSGAGKGKDESRGSRLRKRQLAETRRSEAEIIRKASRAARLAREVQGLERLLDGTDSNDEAFHAAVTKPTQALAAKRASRVRAY